MNIFKKIILALLTSSIAFTSVAFAEGWYAGSEEEETGKFTLGVAYMYRDRPYKGYEDDRKHNIIPLVGYQGDWFFIEGKTLGVKAYKHEPSNLRFDIVGEYVNLGYRESDSNFLSGNDERKDSFELGARVLWKPGDWGLSLYGGYDITSNSDGGEVRAQGFYAYRYDRWTVRPFVNIAWQSHNKVRYYYGVRGKDATMTRPAYSGNDTLNETIGIHVGYNLYEGWKALASAQLEHYGDQIRNSPIVDSDTQFTGILGLAYTF